MNSHSGPEAATEQNGLQTARAPRWARQSLLSSGVVTAAATVWNSLLSLITIPVMVHHLGLAAYGVYTVAFAIAALGSYLDFGLGWTTSKFIAEADAQDDPVLLHATFRASALYHLAIGLLVIVCIMPAAGWIGRSVLHFGPADAAMATAVLRIAAVSFACSSVTGLLISVLRGLRCFTVATAIMSMALTTSLSGAALCAWLGWGVRWAAIAQCVGAALGCGAGLCACFLFLTPYHGSVPVRAQFRGMLAFSVWNFLNRLMQMLALQVDKILVGRFAGAAFLPFYTVPFGIAQKLNSVGGPAVSAIYPTAAAGKYESKERFEAQYHSGSRVVHILTAAGALAFLCWGDRFLAAWMGERIASQGLFFLRIFAVGYWVLSVGSFDSACLEAWNRPRLNALMVLIAVVIGATVAVVLLPILGAGRAIGCGVGAWLCSAGIGEMVAWQRVYRHSMKCFVRRIIVPVVTMAALATVLSYALRFFVYSRITTMAIAPAIACVLAASGILQAFTAAERRQLWQRLTGYLPVRRVSEAPAATIEV